LSGLAFVKQNYERKRDYVKKMPNVYALKIEKKASKKEALQIY